MSKYSTNLRLSALRHWETAEHLGDERVPKHRAIAGYLFGIVAECAIKEIMRNSGMKPLPDDKRRDDPFYAHFPQLKTMLKNSAQGRRAGDLRRWCDDNAFMRHWDTDMRYAPAKDIEVGDIKRWRDNANHALRVMQEA